MRVTKELPSRIKGSLRRLDCNSRTERGVLPLSALIAEVIDYINLDHATVEVTKFPYDLPTAFDT